VGRKKLCGGVLYSWPRCITPDRGGKAEIAARKKAGRRLQLNYYDRERGGYGNQLFLLHASAEIG